MSQSTNESEAGFFHTLREEALRAEFNSIIKVVGYGLAVPLFLIGWIFDWFFSPNDVWALLFVRICFSFSAIMLVEQVKRSDTLNQKETWALVFAGLSGFVCHFVTFWNHYSPYYFFVGLNLVGVASLATIPWRAHFYPIAVLAIYLPFGIWGSYEYFGTPYEVDYVSGWFFCFGTILISIVLRNFNHRLREKELKARIELMKRESELQDLLDKNLQAAHDLRSPVAAMHTLSETIPKEHDQEKLIDRSIERIDEICVKLLDRNSINTLFQTKSEQLQEPLTLKDSLDLVINEKKLEFSDRPGLKFHTDFRIDEAIGNPIDPITLERAISNLINNSVEAIGSQEGRIGVRALTTNSEVWLTVADNGEGIAETKIKRLIKKGIGKKTGMGLSQAKQVVESAGGEMRIDSKGGKGTQVSMIFPRRESLNPIH